MTTTTAPPAVHTAGMRKAFEENVVLDGVDLDVATGSIVALLGPNGAGKTTTVQILTTLLRRDGGEVIVGGHDPATDPAAVRALIGLTGQFSAVDGLLTGRENLRLMARLQHLPAPVEPRVEELLRDFDLVDAADRPASTYSGGMRRRLDLAMSLVARPNILFLDEPTTGLDPVSRRALWGRVRELSRRGTTILLTTQYLEEADQLADHVVVLDHGRIVAAGSPRELKERWGDTYATLHFASADDVARAQQLFPGAAADDERWSVTIATSTEPHALRELFAVLEREDLEPVRLALREPDLDDVFIALTGHAGQSGPKGQDS